MRLLGMDTCPSLNDIMEIRCNKCTRSEQCSLVIVSSKFEQSLLTCMFTLAYHGLLRIGEMTVNNNSCINVIDLNQLRDFM
jgi:hypothetical protein